MERNFILLVWQFGNYEIESSLRKKLIRSPTEIVCYTCVFLNYWAGLQKATDKQAVEGRASVLQQNSLEVHFTRSEDGSQEAPRQMMIAGRGNREGN